MKLTDYSNAASLTGSEKYPVLQNGRVRLSPVNTFYHEKLVFVSNRNDYANSSDVTAPSDNYSRTYRVKRWSHKTLASWGHRLVYANSRALASNETASTNPIMIRAAVESVDGTMSYPVYFNGRREAVIDAGGYVMSDPVGITLPANTAFFIRTTVKVALTGELWPVGQALVTAEGESYTNSDNVDNLINMGANGNPSLGPVAVVGTVVERIPSVLIMGSSAAVAGTDSAIEAGNPTRDMGYAARLLNNEFGYVRIARNSEPVENVLADTRRASLISALKPSHVVCLYGAPNIANGNSFATVQTRLLTLWQRLADQGIRVLQATLTPVTTSTDAWATLENQTPAATTAVRRQVNDWIRTKPTPLSGILDACALVEDNSVSGKQGLWKVDGTANKYTTDGTIVSVFGNGLVAAGLDKSVISF